MELEKLASLDNVSLTTSYSSCRLIQVSETTHNFYMGCSILTSNGLPCVAHPLINDKWGCFNYL
jgi:hypothetical protein